MVNQIRIGTRDSALALWQADQVRAILEASGYSCKLDPVKSEGDLDLSKPLYAMGVRGVFTRNLDTALLAGKIDVAVHSMKDVPVALASGLVQGAVLTRGDARDVLVGRPSMNFQDFASKEQRTIATGSVRRTAQWLHHYPEDIIEPLRGNIQTRLKKLQEGDWDGIIMAAAAIERLEIKGLNIFPLPWMVPAPAQGAILAVCREEDAEIRAALQLCHHEESAMCIDLERIFLRELMGGCSTPISAHAFFKGGEIEFAGLVTAPDGSRNFPVNATLQPSVAQAALHSLAANFLDRLPPELLSNIRNES